MTRNENRIGFIIAVLSASSIIFTGCGDAVKMGEDALREGNFKAAAKHFRKAASANPSNRPIYYNLGVACALAGDHQQAAASFKEVLRFVPGDPDASEYLAYELIAIGKPEGLIEAHALLSEQLQFAEDPLHKARLYTTLSRCDAALHRNDLELGHLLMATKTAPEYRPAQYDFAKHLGKLNLLPWAKSVMEKFAAAPDSDPAMVKKANEYIASIAADAEAAAAAAVQSTEVKAEAQQLVKSGESEFSKKNFKMAEVYFAKALSVDPAFFNAALYRAHSLMSMNRMAEAATAYSVAAAINPNDQESAFLTANCLYGANDSAGAISNLISSTVPKWPDDPKPLMILTYTYVKQNRYYEARLFGDLYVLTAKKAGIDTKAFEKWLASVPAVDFKL